MITRQQLIKELIDIGYVQAQAETIIFDFGQAGYDLDFIHRLLKNKHCMQLINKEWLKVLNNK